MAKLQKNANETASLGKFFRNYWGEWLEGKGTQGKEPRKIDETSVWQNAVQLEILMANQSKAGG